LINAVRVHLKELGQVAPQGAANIRKLVALVDCGDSAIPIVARECLERLIGMLDQLDGQIKELNAEIAVSGVPTPPS
jgi:transposase